MIEVSNLNAFYGKRQILSNINLSVKAGECHFITGPNGSGKSTLLSLISRTNSRKLINTGTINLNGNSIHKMPSKEFAQNVAFMSQFEINAWNFTSKQIILSGRFPHTNFTGIYSKEDIEIVKNVAAKLNITHLLERKIHTLSGGEFQKIRIARTFAQQTQFIIMDEPISSLDFGIEFSLLKQIKSLAKEKNIGILISIHDINLASVFADEISLLSPCTDNTKQQIFSGSVEEIIKPDNLEYAYGKHFGIFTHPEYKTPFIYNLSEQDLT